MNVTCMDRLGIYEDIEIEEVVLFCDLETAKNLSEFMEAVVRLSKVEGNSLNDANFILHEHYIDWIQNYDKCFSDIEISILREDKV